MKKVDNIIRSVALLLSYLYNTVVGLGLMLQFEFSFKLTTQNFCFRFIGNL